MAWDVPRATHTYLEDNLLDGGFPSIRTSFLARFVKLYYSLRRSNSLALRVMASISATDIRSVTGSNLFHIKKETKLDPTSDMMYKVKQAILDIRADIPMQDGWRILCLNKFLAQQYVLEAQHQDTDELDKLIDSICIS